MKIEMDDNAGMAIPICFTVLCIIIMIISLYKMSQTTTRSAFEHGYVEHQRQGDGYYWTKP